MRLLLDAHALLWWLNDDSRLTRTARAAIADPASAVFVSAAVVWELEIKARLGRLDLHGIDVSEDAVSEGFHELPLTARHAQCAARLPPHHADPFDRALVAQCMVESLTFVSKDGALAAYGVPLLW